MEGVVSELRLMRGELSRVGADVSTMKDILVDMMEGKRIQRKKDAERKRAMRERDTQDRQSGRIPLPDFCPLTNRDKRLETRGDFLLWAHVGMEFGKDNDVRNFFTYLTLAWNQSVYHEKVITRSGNRPHVWKGNIRRRNAETWSALFGGMKGRVTDMVLADLPDLMWFSWGFAVVYPVWHEMKKLPGFDQLPDRFVQACLLVQGGMGEYCIDAETNLFWDPHNSMEDRVHMRRHVPALWYAWGACKEGLEITSFANWRAPFEDMLKRAGDAYAKTKRTRAREAAGRAFLDKIRAQRLPTPEQVEELALSRAISLSLQDRPPPRNPDDVEEKTL